MTHPQAPWQFQGHQELKLGDGSSSWKSPPLPQNGWNNLYSTYEIIHPIKTNHNIFWGCSHLLQKDGAHSVCQVYSSLNNSTSYLSVYLSLNSLMRHQESDFIKSQDQVGLQFKDHEFKSQYGFWLSSSPSQRYMISNAVIPYVISFLVFFLPPLTYLNYFPRHSSIVLFFLDVK